jgi:hypothetical protein
VRARLVTIAAPAGAVVLAAAVLLATGGDDAQPAGSGGGAFVRSVPGERAVVWAVGDGADDTPEAGAVSARLTRVRVDRLLYLGDVYERGTAEEFAGVYAPTYGRLARVTAPVSGNHEAANEATGYDPYWRAVHGRTPPDWYAFRAGGWTLLALDSEAAHGPGSAQLRWLRRQVRKPGTCRIAFWHRPRFSAGRHGDQPDMAPVWNALRGRARIVLAGHDHDMQRFRPIDGITSFVSGAGGRHLYLVRPDRRLAFADDTSFGALRLILRPGAADHAFIAADGRKLDHGRVRCRTRP